MENTGFSKETSDVVILVNGPGELSSYVKPTVEALNKRSANIRIVLLFTPCPYSTGKEVEIAKSIPGVAHVITDKEFTRWALFRVPPEHITFSRRGVVVFMGGDILYGKVIAKRLKYPALAYSEAYAKWPKIYKKFLVPDKMIFDKFKIQGFPENQLQVVGNLMVDSVRSDRSREQVFDGLKLDRNKKLISFLPGSREFQISFTLSFFSKVADDIRQLMSNIQFAFVISPYLPESILKKYMDKADPSIKLVTSDQHSIIKASDLVITVPGTNTAEVAVLGTPMMVVFPLNNSQLIPLEGIWEIIGKIPVLGFLFKKFYVKIALLKTRFFAIPNIKSGLEIVPELKGNIQPKTIAENAVSLMDNTKKLNEMRIRLKNCLGNAGAKDRIAREILELIK